MQIDMLFKIAGVGILVTVIAAVLTRTGREEMAMLTTVAGLVIVLLMVVDMIAGMLTQVKSIFHCISAEGAAWKSCALRVLP